MEHLDRILVLENGWYPIAAFTMENEDPGMKKFTGLVLAERVGPSRNPDRWCVWNIYREEHEEDWDASTGDYFSDKQRAEFAFGLRLRRYALPAEMRRGTDQA